MKKDERAEQKTPPAELNPIGKTKKESPR